MSQTSIKITNILLISFLLMTTFCTTNSLKLKKSNGHLKSDISNKVKNHHNKAQRENVMEKVGEHKFENLKEDLKTHENLEEAKQEIMEKVGEHKFENIKEDLKTHENLEEAKQEIYLKRHHEKRVEKEAIKQKINQTRAKFPNVTNNIRENNAEARQKRLQEKNEAKEAIKEKINQTREKIHNVTNHIRESKSKFMNKTKNNIADILENKMNQEKNFTEEFKTRLENKKNEIKTEINNTKQQAINYKQTIHQKRQEAKNKTMQRREEEKNEEMQIKEKVDSERTKLKNLIQKQINQTKIAKRKFENLKEKNIQNIKNYTETMRHKGRNLRKNITKLNEKKLNAEVQEALEKKETENEVIEKLKELAEELVGYTKKAKKLRTDEEIFKVDAARKFRDAKKSMQAKKYKGLRLADVIKSAKEKIIEEAKKTLTEEISKKSIELGKAVDEIKANEERELRDSTKNIIEEAKEQNAKEERRQKLNEEEENYKNLITNLRVK